MHAKQGLSPPDLLLPHQKSMCHRLLTNSSYCLISFLTVSSSHGVADKSGIKHKTFENSVLNNCKRFYVIFERRWLFRSKFQNVISCYDIHAIVVLFSWINCIIFTWKVNIVVTCHFQRKWNNKHNYMLSLFPMKFTSSSHA